MLWSGLTHSVLGAPVNSTVTFNIVNCAIKQSDKSPPQSVVKRIEYFNRNALYKCYIISYHKSILV